MKQDQLLDALQYIDDALLESAADSMAEKKRYAIWFWITAAAACLVLVVGIWAMTRQMVSPPDGNPVLQVGATVMTNPTQIAPNPMEPTESDPAPTEPPVNQEPDSSEPMEFPICPDPPMDSTPPMPNKPQQPEGSRPQYSPQVPVDVPKYDEAGFTAEELGVLFSASFGDTIYYDQVGFPNDQLSDLASPPNADYINIYQSADCEAATQKVAKGVMYDILPRLEILLDEKLPAPKLFTENVWEVNPQNHHITIKNYAGGIEITCKTGNSYTMSSEDPALKINGISLSVRSTDTDQQVMESLSTVIPYLEDVFDMDLSGYKIYRNYAFSENMGYLSYMEVYLYSNEHVVDPLLEQYEDLPRRYLSGEILCLNFSQTDREGEMDTVICRGIEFITQPQSWFEPVEQRKMLTLAEAEALLAKGYVFCPHYCPLCLQEQGAVDFSNYDRVSLEYVYGKDYAIPFYTFYKKLGDNADGSVRYAKTMIPAVDATGMEEYFENQLQYHGKYPD